jgi:hypothetical protein
MGEQSGERIGDAAGVGEILDDGDGRDIYACFVGTLLAILEVASR